MYPIQLSFLQTGAVAIYINQDLGAHPSAHPCPGQVVFSGSGGGEMLFLLYCPQQRGGACCPAVLAGVEVQSNLFFQQLLHTFLAPLHG